MKVNGCQLSCQCFSTTPPVTMVVPGPGFSVQFRGADGGWQFYTIQGSIMAAGIAVNLRIHRNRKEFIGE